jgi:dTDP-4-dehydrorhamnose reductase
MVSLKDSYQRVLYTSREPDNRLTWLPQRQRRQFQLSDSETWSNIPSDADLVWCFPASPLSAVQRFASWMQPLSRRLVVLGSTSAYDVGGNSEYPPPWIDETAPIDLGRPRVQGEEFLRNECRAVVLRVAGIYGPGRHPYDWIKTGRVALSRKYVNLIHVEDLAAICLAALKYGMAGTVYNVSDGTPRTWSEIGRELYGDELLKQDIGAQQEPSGKRIDTTKLRSMLAEARTSMHHPDLFRSLKQLRQSGVQTRRDDRDR